MPDPITIKPPSTDPFGLDYESLRAAGIALVQAMSGEIWTDYNAHDPGVTTLEQLCYALSELGYRVGFSIPDLLATPLTNRIDPARHGLYIARDIFPVNPVTIGDYRKLLVDRVKVIRNAWLEPRTVDGIDGFYYIVVYAPGNDPCALDEEGRPISPTERARQVYMEHRDLCEDLAEVVLARELPTEVSAMVEIGANVDADLVLAEIMFAIGEFLAPELSRRSLEESLATGQSPSELMTGPLLLRGFSPDDELQPKRCAIPVRAIGAAISDVSGVLGVRKLQAVVEATVYGPRETIEIRKSDVLVFMPYGTGRCSRYTIELTRKQVVVTTDPARVDRLLAQMWALYRMDYPLEDQYAQLLGVPRGEHRDLAAYTSIQDQYPTAYGITAYGLPAEADAVRRGQAKQLKGYLLVFEQLLADFFAQLAYVKRLYSTERHLAHTYVYQSLCPSVPDVEPIVKGGCGPDGAYLSGLAALVASHDPVVERRNRLTSFLLALYAEGLDAASLFDGQGGNRVTSREQRLLVAKLALLREVVAISADRGRAFDYERRPGPDNVTGMTRKCRIQLEMEPEAGQCLSDRLDELGADVVDSDGTASLGRTLGRHAEHVDSSFSSVPTWEEVAPEHVGALGEASWLHGRTMAPDFISAASELGNFRYGRLPADETVALVCKTPGSDDWLFVARYPTDEAACDGAREIVGVMGSLRRRSEQLFIIEHILLRWAKDGDDDGAGADPRSAERAEAANTHAPAIVGDRGASDFEYSFTITAVVAGGRDRVRDPDYQRFAREVIRSNTPTHIESECCFIGPRALVRFERLYWAWRAALLDPCGPRAETSRRLEAFLTRCRAKGHTARSGRGG